MGRVTRSSRHRGIDPYLRIAVVHHAVFASRSHRHGPRSHLAAPTASPLLDSVKNSGRGREKAERTALGAGCNLRPSSSASANAGTMRLHIAVAEQVAVVDTVSMSSLTSTESAPLGKRM
jgi:hypothetical protein